ncbi:MAG: pitrilysin family protein [Bdellovibrionota bacterium]
MSEAAAVHRHILSNGLNLLFIPNRRSPVVALQGWVRYGAADESDDIAGVAHLFEHLLFKGTTNRAVGEIAREIEGLGGDLNAYTTYDHTVMHLTLASKYAHQGIDILGDALLNSIVEESELANERPVILEEIKRRNDMPGAIAGDLFRGELFRGHSYGRPVIGFDHVVAGIPREKIMEEYKRHYTTEHLFVVVCGDFDEKQMLAHCEKVFAKTPKGPARRKRPELAALPTQRSFFINHETPDSLVHIGWRVPGNFGIEVAALDAFALILGQGESSRLYRKLVNELDLVRGIGASVWSPRETGSFSVSFKTTDKLAPKMAEIEAAIHECLQRDVTAAELEKARKNLLSSTVYSRESVDGLAERYAYCESIAEDWEADSRYRESVENLRVVDLHKARDHYLVWKDALCAGIVPQKEALPEFKARTSATAKSKSAAAKKSSFKPGTHGVQTLNYNGLTVLLRSSHDLPMFSLRWVGWGGQRLEPAAKSGIGALWTRAVCEGARLPNGAKLTREEINERIDAASSSMSSFHGRNSFGFQMDGLSADFETLMELLAGTVVEPSFENDIVKQSLDHQLQDIKTQTQNPGSLVSRKFNEMMFGNHAYGRSALGEAARVKKFTSKDLKAYHELLVRQPQVLSITGDITAERLEMLLKKLFGKKIFPKLSTLRKSQKVRIPSKPIEHFHALKKEQMHILWGFPTCTLGSKDRWPLLALASVWSGQGGRLFSELRDKMSLCYTVSPTHMEGLDAGYFAFYMGTSPEKTHTALKGMKIEIEKVLSEKIPDAEWKKAHKYVTGNYEIGQQSLGAQSMGMALDELYGLGYEEYFEFDKSFSKVTPADIQRVARKYLDPKKAKSQVLSLVGPVRPKGASLKEF